MKKSLKIMSFVTMIVFASSLASCKSNAGFKLPKVEGKEVQLTNAEISARFENFNGDLQTSKVIQTNAKIHSKFDSKDDKFEGLARIKATHNLRNSDLLLDETYEEKMNDGVINATFKGYENPKKTYFEIERSSNLKFDNEEQNYNINNGKYVIEKNPDHPVGLSKVLNTFDLIDMDASFIPVLSQMDLVLILELNELNYDKVKFYEDDDFFSISLKVDLSGIKEEKADIKTAFEKSFSILKDDAISAFNYEAVLIFKDNNLHAAGVNFKYEFEEIEDGYTNIGLNEIVIATEYIISSPGAPIGSDYQAIENPSEIIKN